MGKGIEAAKELSPEHAQLVEDLRDQLLIVFLKRMGGKVEIPVAEMDDTSQDLFAMRVDPETKVFHFSIHKKH